MGLFFDQRKPDPRLVELVKTAIQTPQSPDPERHIAAMMDQFKPLAEPLTIALAAAPQADPADAEKLATAKAEAITNELLGGASFNTGRFLTALAIFAVLLGAAIGTDAAGLKTSPPALFALATTVFGVVVGFLGSEKA